MNAWKRFKEFFHSDNFNSDPYGYLTNQIGHVVLGCYVVTLVVGLCYNFVCTEYPEQWPFAVGCMFAYFLLWELGVQGWKGLDSIEDSLYFSLGASLWLFIDMSIVIDRLLMWSLVFTVLLGIGVMRRLPQQ